jgi:hypothetical protein
LISLNLNLLSRIHHSSTRIPLRKAKKPSSFCGCRLRPSWQTAQVSPVASFILPFNRVWRLKAEQKDFRRHCFCCLNLRYYCSKLHFGHGSGARRNFRFTLSSQSPHKIYLLMGHRLVLTTSQQQTEALSFNLTGEFELDSS